MESDRILAVLQLLRRYWPRSELGGKKSGDFVPIREWWHKLDNISSSSNESMKKWHIRAEVIGQARFDARTLGKVMEYQGQGKSRGKLIQSVRAVGTVTYSNKRQ